MNLDDRIQALMRSKKYKKDFEKYIEQCRKKGIADKCIVSGSHALIFPLSDEAKKLCKRYEIPYPVSPEPPEVLPKTSGEKATHFPLPPVVQVPRIEKGKPLWGLEDGRYFTVKIDFVQTLEGIRKVIDELYAYYSPRAKADERDRESIIEDEPKALTHWQVYDVVERGKMEGKSILSITKEFVGINESPSNNPRVKTYYERIRNAYRKAEKQIREVEF